MSAQEEIIEQTAVGAQADAGELKARRRAKSIVHEAMRDAGTPLENRGLSNRLLPGLWYATINILIACLAPEQILALLTDRGRGIIGNGDNSDVPPKSIPDKSMMSYIAEVVGAGETIVECLMLAEEKLEEENLDDRFPETVLDSALLVLLQAWGPNHVRRAIAEQSSGLIRGIIEPVNFMEPARLLKFAGHSKPEEPRPPAESERVLPEKPAEEPAGPIPDKPTRRKSEKRRVNAYFHSDLSPSGKGAWAIFLSLFDDNRQEERLISGVKHDPNGRASWVAAVHECILAICDGTEKVSARIETTSEGMVRAVQGAPGTRLPSEEQVWKAVDAACAHHNLEFQTVNSNLSRPVIEKVDMQIRRLLSEN